MRRIVSKNGLPKLHLVCFHLFVMHSQFLFATFSLISAACWNTRWKCSEQCSNSNYFEPAETSNKKTSIDRANESYRKELEKTFSEVGNIQQSVLVLLPSISDQNSSTKIIHHEADSGAKNASDVKKNSDVQETEFQDVPVDELSYKISSSVQEQTCSADSQELGGGVKDTFCCYSKCS
jgi:hypothetical protein